MRFAKPMFHWIENPLLPGLCFALAGKVALDNFPVAPLLVYCLAVVVFLISGLFLLPIVAFKIPQIRLFRQTLSFCLYFIFGCLIVFLHQNDKKIPTHEAFVARIKEESGLTAKGKIRCLAEVVSIKQSTRWIKTEGSIILFFEGDPGVFANGKFVLINRPLAEMESPTIPGQFDAKTYFGRKGIHYQCFASRDDWRMLPGQQPDWLLSRALDARQFLETLLYKHLPTKDDASLVAGLLLGLKRNLDPDLKVAFSATGLSHILAVSGMHVGLILTFLTTLFGRVRSLPYGKYLFSGLLLVSLWFYALVTGLSPSVLRAVTIFSLLQMGTLMRKPNRPINMLCLGTIILFSLDPDIIYDVGYQLSFIAVWGIISFQKPINDWFSIKNKWLKWLWNATAVTLAATLATLPVTLYYFHQFPVYFLIANVVAVPVSTGIIYGTIGMIGAAIFPSLADLVGMGLHWAIWIFTQYVKMIHNWPYATIESVFFPGYFMVFLVLALILFQLWMQSKFTRYLNISLLIFNVFLLSFLGYNLYLWNRPPENYIIRTGTEWMLARVEGRKALLSLLAYDKPKADDSFEARALREGLHVLDIQTKANPGQAISTNPKRPDRKSFLVNEGGNQFLFLGHYLRCKPVKNQKVPLDYLVVWGVGKKTLANALLQFQPKEIWLNVAGNDEPSWRNDPLLTGYHFRNFRHLRFVKLKE